MCGVVGISAMENVNQQLFDALTVLQHRGQDAAGIVTLNEGRFFLRKDNGLVKDVFRTRHMKRLLGRQGIGHVRYPTAGSSSSAEAQPFYVNSPYGIVLAHNGNLTNAAQIKQALYETDLRHINTHSDSEILLNVLAHQLEQNQSLNPTPEDIFAAVTEVYRRCEGGFAVVALINGHGMLAFRDPFGIRPLVFGRRVTDAGTEYMVASESVALDVLGFELVRDVAPGEAIFISQDHTLHSHQCVPGALHPCLFEYIYFARPDSRMDGISVYESRLRMGQVLANQILREWPEHDIDVVMPIPDTSRNSALELATRLGLPYREGFVKNRYIGRTFIMPGQAVRKKSVRQKLNAMQHEFAGKNVLLVDDSIVRGTTCEQIITMAREAGAKKVYFCSAAPAVRFPNVYGIDMPTKEELIAHNRSEDEVAELINADRLFFLDLQALEKTIVSLNPLVDGFDSSVFNGCYIAGNIDDDYLACLAAVRNDTRYGELSDMLDLHNEAND